MNRISHFRSNGVVAIISFLGSLLIPSAAFAHHAEWMKDKPFIQGLSMPVHGLDHLLVTFAVGLIAVRIGGYALWTVPAAFSFLLLLGGIMNVSGIAVPFAEHAIFASIIVLGGLLAYRRQLPLLVGLAVVAFFAMFHGIALVGEGSAQRLVFRICGRLPNRCLRCFGQRNDRRNFTQEIESGASHPICWMGNDWCRRINRY